MDVDFSTSEIFFKEIVRLKINPFGRVGIWWFSSPSKFNSPLYKSKYIKRYILPTHLYIHLIISVTVKRKTLLTITYELAQKPRFSKEDLNSFLKLKAMLVITPKVTWSILGGGYDCSKRATAKLHTPLKFTLVRPFPWTLFVYSPSHFDTWISLRFY